jgi:hypothetical protein
MLRALSLFTALFGHGCAGIALTHWRSASSLAGDAIQYRYGGLKAV